MEKALMRAIANFCLGCQGRKINPKKIDWEAVRKMSDIEIDIAYNLVRNCQHKKCHIYRYRVGL